MTDQHTPFRQLSAGSAEAVAPGGDGTEAPARPAKPRAPKPAVAPAAKPVAKAARARAGTQADAVEGPVTHAPASAPDNVAAAPVALVHTPVALRAADAEPPLRQAEPAAAPDVVAPDLAELDGPAADELLADGGDDEIAAAAVLGDEPEAEGMETDADELGTAVPQDGEDEEDEEEAPRAHARMPGMGGGMARPGMRPISPQLGGRPTPAPRIPSKAENFVEGDHVVYPTHGVGRVERIATEEIAGHKLELIHITFEENRMTLRVPVAKARSAGLRKLATRKMFDEALAVLRGRARIKRTMWSRRAQEYEAKINSGDPLSIAEVVRDLHRNAGQPDQSFSERQIYEAAMDRLAAELAALDQTEKSVAATKLVDYLKTV